MIKENVTKNFKELLQGVELIAAAKTELQKKFPRQLTPE